MPDGITIATPKPTEIVISGTDKQQVGQVAAEIRELSRSAEPYKGKGVKLRERVRSSARKARRSKATAMSETIRLRAIWFGSRRQELAGHRRMQRSVARRVSVGRCARRRGRPWLSVFRSCEAHLRPGHRRCEGRDACRVPRHWTKDLKGYAEDRCRSGRGVCRRQARSPSARSQAGVSTVVVRPRRLSSITGASRRSPTAAREGGLSF